jgi:hypothetical protein
MPKVNRASSANESGLTKVKNKQTRIPSNKVSDFLWCWMNFSIKAILIELNIDNNSAK